MPSDLRCTLPISCKLFPRRTSKSLLPPTGHRPRLPQGSAQDDTKCRAAPAAAAGCKAGASTQSLHARVPQTRIQAARLQQHMADSDSRCFCLPTVDVSRPPHLIGTFAHLATGTCGYTWARVKQSAIRGSPAAQQRCMRRHRRPQCKTALPLHRQRLSELLSAAMASRSAMAASGRELPPVTCMRLL